MFNGHTSRSIVAIVVVILVASVLPLQIANGQASRAEIDKIEGSQLKLTVELYSEVFNDQKVAAANRLVADDAVIHTPRGEFIGPDGLLEYVDSLHATYLDALFEVTSIELTGDSIVVQWTMTATQFSLDPVQGPSTIPVESHGETKIVVADGQVVALNQAERGTAVQLPEDIAAQD